MQEMMLMGLGGSGDEYEHPYGDLFLGEVSASELITGDALASLVGLTAGTAQNSDAGWLKFLTGEDKNLYVAKKTIRYSVSWKQLNELDLISGLTTIEVNDQSYIVRLLTGANTDQVPTGYGHDLDYTWGSEWNRFFYPLIPNPSNSNQIPTYPISGEGIEFGAWASYSETELGIRSGSGIANWCQETNAAGNGSVYRGSASVAYINTLSNGSTIKNVGWRPVLELVE